MLEVRGLTVRRDGKTVLEDVTFKAERGITLVVGPNGAGKTTLFLAILGAVLHQGVVCINGICGRERALKIGYVPQRLKPEARATVWEYVYLPAAFRGVKDAERAAEKALEIVGIAHLRNKPVDSLSGGQLQRAAVARALALEGEVLLLDEPLANIDPEGRVEFLSLLTELKDRTVLMSTHDLTLPSTVADKVLLLNRRVIAYGPLDEVMKEDVLSKVYRYVKVMKTPAGYLCITEDFAHPH